MHAWDDFIAAQEAELGSETVQKWLKTLKVVRYDACNLYLEAKDAFQSLWFEEHMRKKLQAKFVNNNNKRIKVHLSIENAQAKAKSGRPVKAKSSKETPPVAFSLLFDPLDPHCIFDYFFVSESNLLTAKVFHQAEGKGEGQEGISSGSAVFNPIYVYGPSGSGKTHLLMATAAVMRNQGRHVIYSRAQTFTDHVVAAIRAGEMSVFRQAYRNSDVLIIDDVHAFSRKGATQEEFFHTFNTLHVAGKQIILSANCPPGELEYIEPRLVSRFEWGIMLALEAPDRADSQKILLTKTGTLQFPLHQKVMDFLLDSFQSTKSLAKAVEALILRSHLNQSDLKSSLHLSVPSAKQILSDLLLQEQQALLTPPKILQGVAEYFGIKPEDILGKAQTRDYVLPRQISMYLCRHQLKIPFVKIGSLFGKDHSTVMSSVKLIQKGIDTDDAEIAGSYRAILKKIKP